MTMPSPFPGMDPYLEHPNLFPGLHNRLVAVLSESLQAKLPPPYFAEIGERVCELYLRKQRELLDSPVPLVEIALLRGGMHTPAVPLDRLVAQVGAFDYQVSIHRFDRFEDFLVYPIRLEERLPEIAIPLL